jgi:hypothetical protein
MRTHTAPWDMNRHVGLPKSISCPRCGDFAVFQGDRKHKFLYCFTCGIIDLAPDHDVIIADAEEICKNRQLLITNGAKIRI